MEPVAGSHPYWKLCYRASSYGWAASTFHSNCDGKHNTVTIIKRGQYVFGGYTDIPWGMTIMYSSLSPEDITEVYKLFNSHSIHIGPSLASEIPM